MSAGNSSTTIFRNAEARNKLINSQAFIPENNIIAGVKVYENRGVSHCARWREGSIDIKLCLFKRNKRHFQFSTLIPYPSWEFQEEIGNCSCLQYVQSMTYDLFGRMWL
ncbi:Protein yellow [Orchesella cincta]|uniref:Protein yellow n=1 Tax=Orchesella cincta TaxID=48709 RepID=A0A1D2MGD0_ORCCI|nr:Protein yellow [Orchesella cincta]